MNDIIRRDKNCKKLFNAYNALVICNVTKKN